MLQRIKKTAKRLSEKSIALYHKVRGPLERVIERQSIPVRYASGVFIIIFGVVNVPNPFLNGWIMIIAGTGVIAKTRKGHKELIRLKKMQPISIIIIEKTKASLHEIKTIGFKQIMSDKFHAVSEYSKSQLQEIFSSPLLNQ